MCFCSHLRQHKPQIDRSSQFVNISTSSICSLDYSVLDDGGLFVVQDLKGELLFLRSDRYTPLTSVKTDVIGKREKLVDAMLEPSTPRHGQICFSRPSGRYLVQSGGCAAEDGHLIVWNAQLGAECGKKFYVVLYCSLAFPSTFFI